MDAEHTQATATPARPANGMWVSLSIALGAGLLVLLVAFAPALWLMLVGTPAEPAVQGAPWHVQRLAGGGIDVFKLRLPGTTLADVQRRWGPDMRVAVMARPGKRGALEAYVERHVAAGIEGRLVLAFAATDADIERWRAAQPGERLDGGTIRHALDAKAVVDAGAVALAGVSFVAGSSLNGELLQARFGEPAERKLHAGGVEHWLYPAIGLAVALDPKGKDVLQYVAPSDFERLLRAPLSSS